MKIKTVETGIRKPDWLKINLTGANEYAALKKIFRERNLHTICESGNCPNMGECWKAGTATLMILGDICTRSCRFCAVATGKPQAPDLNEPEHIAKAVADLKLKHVVLTSVDRDDLPDGGAEIWSKTILETKRQNPKTTIEALIPDFKGNRKDIFTVINSKPEIISHNLETVERLSKTVRVQAKYHRSLDVLNYLRENSVITKTGIMVGLGETDEEIIKTMKDAFVAGALIFTIGQYLQPTKNHLQVDRYVSPELFNFYKSEGLKMGYKFVESGPLVRSSYHAEKHLCD
ncbi:MAG: lipoyl synthase [Bacteroidales bacterium]|nr:lipoyl synthase [Bacteroidales bacterium]